MKLVFISTSFSVIYYMRYHKVVKLTYDKEHDTFRYLFLVLPCLGLAMLINQAFTFFPLLPDPRLGRLSSTDGAPVKRGGMGLLTIIKKVKAKEREMRLLMVCVGGPSPAPPLPPAAPAAAPAGPEPRGGGGR